MNAITDSGEVPEVRAAAGEYQTFATAAAQRQRCPGAGQRHDRQFPRRARLEYDASASIFTQTDFDERQRVVLLGQDAYKELFPNGEYPIDQTVQINNLNFRVIGVMESKGGGPGGNQDKSAFLPLSTAQDRLFKQKTVNGQYELSVIYASVADAESMDAAQQQLTELMRERRDIKFLDQDDFSIISQNDLISVFGDILGALTIFLGAIAAISLLVGGIGIMNIMLVSVTERTREIGLRKAVGAKRGDVLIQFLIEAVTLAVVGGMIGILLGRGHGVSASAPRLTRLTPSSASMPC